ncbi:MAG: DegV family protein [Chloroflexota bacterium]|nr:DegV family protein [Chloroflexota bacterium]
MSKIAIVTDSTVHVTPEIIEQYGIHVIPLEVIWGQETFRDGIDMTPPEFYTRLQTTDIIPTTSQPSVAKFKTIFEKLDAKGFDILAILISSGISGTVDSAVQAKKMLPEANIEVVDSLASIVETGFHIVAAARAADDGADLAKCKTIAENARERSGVFFAVDTLEFLHRGGRIGGGKRFLGTVLNIKPILTLNEGRIDAVEQVRTRAKAHTRLLELLDERTQGKRLSFVGVSHASAQSDAEALLKRAEERFDVGETMLSELSPVIGTHTGPGTVALAYMIEE